MTYKIIHIFCLITATNFLMAQPAMEVGGSMTIGNNSDLNPQSGTMRWSGSDLEVWNGALWASMTGNKEVGMVQDIDGNSYNTIRIGTQVWMTENLRVSNYRDGTAIVPAESDAVWEALTIGAWCWFDNDMSYENPYGKLYNWYATEDIRGLCPSGWHVSTSADWNVVLSFLGEPAGGKMKVVGTSHWDIPNKGATNSSGFSGLPGGSRNSFGNFSYTGSFGSWWEKRNDGQFRVVSMHRGSAFLSFLGGNIINSGYSVRCIED